MIVTVASQFEIVKTGPGRRSTARRELKLRSQGASRAGRATDVIVKNLSATGMLLETSAELALGDKIAIDLPETGKATAKVVWTSTNLAGCKFEKPLSTAALSAAQLRGEPNAMPAETGRESTASKTPAPGALPSNRIRQLRKAKGMSLADFARKMNVSRPTVWAWESGKSSPRPAKRRLMLEVLGVAENDLNESGGDPKTEGQDAPAAQRSLMVAIAQAKETIAAVAGTRPEKITLIIEV
jgi:transcriptional regulator with XRE-family HTH domain